MLSTLSILALLAAPGDLPAAPSAARRPRLPALRSEVSEFAPDGARLAIAAAGHRVLVLDVSRGAVAAELDCGEGDPVSIAWRPDGGRVAVLDRFGDVRVFDPIGAQLLRIATAALRDNAAFELRVVTYAAGGRVLIASLGTPTEIFDAEDGRKLARLSITKDARITALATSRDGERVALGDERDRVAIWSARTGELLHGPVSVDPGSAPRGIESLEFDGTGERVAVGNGDCRARIWTLADRGPMRALSHCDDDQFGGLGIRHVAFSPDGKVVATTSTDWRTTRLWDLESGRRIHSLSFGPGATRATFLAGGLLLLDTGGIVVDVASGHALHALEPVAGWQHAANYRAARGLAWVARAGSFRVCDVVTGRPVLEVEVEER